MWRYISPAAVFTTSFSTDTTVKTGLIFKTIKKRGTGLANIDAALESLRDNFRPKTNPEDTAGHLILVLRQAKAWLRKMDTKKQKHAKESKGRLQKRQAIELLAKECLDMLVYCSPTLAKALQSFNSHKGQGPGFTMKSLAKGYDHERNLYLKNNKTGLSSVSGKGAHEFLDGGDTKFSKTETKALSSSAKSALRKVNQGKLDFYALNDEDFKAIGELAKAKMINAEVKFFDKIERLKLLLTVSNGKLMKADGNPFASSSLATTPPSGNFSRWDQWMWAMDGQVLQPLELHGGQGRGVRGHSGHFIDRPTPAHHQWQRSLQADAPESVRGGRVPGSGRRRSQRLSSGLPGARERQALYL